MILHAVSGFSVFQMKAYTKLKWWEPAGSPKHNNPVSAEESIKGTSGPKLVVHSGCETLAVKGNNEGEKSEEVLSGWSISREEWQTGNLEGNSGY